MRTPFLIFLALGSLNAQILQGIFADTPVAAGGPTINAGFEFRGTSGYVSTVAGDIFVDNTAGTTNYPQTATIGGFSTTYGWYPSVFLGGFSPPCTASTTALDRSNTVDARLAGLIVINGGGSGDCISFGVLLASAGTYDVVIAAGDANSSQGPMTVQVYDGTTLLSTLVNNLATSAAGRWYDAGGTERTATTWVSTGATVKATVTLTTTHFNLVLRTPAADAGTISYFHITNH